MTVGKAIYYLLNNSTDLEAVVGTRIFPEVAEQDSALPFVMYSVISNEPSDTHSGPSLLDVAQVDVIAYNTSYSGCIDMGVYVRAALDRVTGTYNGVNVQSCQYNSEVIDFDEYKRAYVITQSYDVRISRTEFEIAQGTPVTGARLGDLYDVTDDATTGQVIIKQADGTWAGGDAAATLGDLTDVTITDPLEHDSLIYDSVSGEWVNGIPTDIPVINKSGADIPAGAPLKADGVQGDRVEVDIWNPSNDGELFMGLAADDIADNATGFCRQVGIVHHLDTSAWPVGTVLYVTFSGQLTDTPLPARFRSIPVAIVLRSHENTGRLFVRTWRPDYSISDLTNVDTTGATAGRSLVYDQINATWVPGNTVPRAAYDLADVYDYSGGSIGSGSILVWDATNGYWFPQPKVSFLPDTSVYYLGQYDTEAGTGRTAASTASITVERYLTIQGNGEGESISAQSDTPSSGNKIVRKIWYKANSFEQSDVDTWTLVHTFADDTAYSATEATFEALLNAQTYGTPPFTLAQSWEDVPAFTGLLDDYPGAAAAYSLRLLDADYSGSAINVRRASDNAVQDIGFDANGDLDTSALATFCAGTDGFVVRWYDQSGNSNDAVQATTSAQPKVYDSVTGVVTDNARPSFDFDGSNDYLTTGAISELDSDVQSSFCVASAGTTAAGLSILWRSAYTSGSSTNNLEMTGAFRNAAFIGFHARDASGTYKGVINAATTNQFLVSTNWNASDVVSANLDGASFTTNNTTGATATPTGHLLTRIGATSALVSSYWVGKIQEVIIYPSDQSANRAAIEANINAFYSIY